MCVCVCVCVCVYERLQSGQLVLQPSFERGTPSSWVTIVCKVTNYTFWLDNLGLESRQGPKSSSSQRYFVPLRC